PARPRRPEPARRAGPMRWAAACAIDPLRASPGGGRVPRRAGVLAALLFVLATATAGSGAAGRQADGHDCPGATLYDPDPEHPWNRVHHALQVRARPGGDEFGHDEVDPLLWRE